MYRPRKDERLSWPSWLSYSGWLTHISGHPSAAGRAQDRESSPVRDRRSTTVPRHQLLNGCVCVCKMRREMAAPSAVQDPEAGMSGPTHQPVGRAAAARLLVWSGGMWLDVRYDN